MLFHDETTGVIEVKQPFVIGSVETMKVLSLVKNTW